jgi:hypothetical protein
MPQPGDELRLEDIGGVQEDDTDNSNEESLHYSEDASTMFTVEVRR